MTCGSNLYCSASTCLNKTFVVLSGMHIWKQNGNTLGKGIKTQNSSYERGCRRVGVSIASRCTRKRGWVGEQQVLGWSEGGATGAWAWASFAGVGWKSACLDFYIIKLRQLARCKRLSILPCHAPLPYIRIATSGLHRFENTVWLGLVACRFGSVHFSFSLSRIVSARFRSVDPGPRTTGYGLRATGSGLWTTDFAGQLWR